MIIFDNKNFNIESPTIVSVGKFDGEHRGHLKVIKNMKELAVKYNYKTVIFTFSSPPNNILNNIEVKQLYTNAEKRIAFNSLGIDYLIEYPLDKNLLEMGAEEFIKKILIDKLNMKSIVGGKDIGFAKNREGNRDKIVELSNKYNFQTLFIEKEKNTNNNDISTSMIKEYLSNGHIGKANDMLGYSYGIKGKVVSGNKIGKIKLGFPTINIFPDIDKFLPKFGVYATYTKLLNSGEIFMSLTNIGRNPSVSNDSHNHSCRVETYIYDFDGDLYNKYVDIRLEKFIRPERKFDNLEELKKQMDMDKDIVYRYFGGML